MKNISTTMVDLTRVQEKALIQYAIKRILEEKMENEIDKWLEKTHNKVYTMVPQ